MGEGKEEEGTGTGIVHIGVVSEIIFFIFILDGEAMLVVILVAFSFVSASLSPLILPLARRPCPTDSHHARNQIFPT